MAKINPLLDKHRKLPLLHILIELMKSDILFQQVSYKQGNYNGKSILIGSVWGLTTRQSLWAILCHLPEKGRKKIEETVEEIKERGREKRGTGIKVKKKKK